jgi:hypothetical protein
LDGEDKQRKAGGDQVSVSVESDAFCSLEAISKSGGAHFHIYIVPWHLNDQLAHCRAELRPCASIFSALSAGGF